jgi:hypothetical protein
LKSAGWKAGGRLESLTPPQPASRNFATARYHQNAMSKLTVDNVCAAYADKGVKIAVKPLLKDLSAISQ